MINMLMTSFYMYVVQNNKPTTIPCLNPCPHMSDPRPLNSCIKHNCPISSLIRRNHCVRGWEQL